MTAMPVTDHRIGADPFPGQRVEVMSQCCEAHPSDYSVTRSGEFT